MFLDPRGRGIIGCSVGIAMMPVFGRDDEGPFLLFPADPVSGKARKLRVDFLNDEKYRRQLRGKQEMIAKALGGEGLVYDLTLGLAEDAWTMLRLGFQVLGVEREPLLAELLKEAQARAAADPRWGAMASRLEVRQGESREILREIAEGKLPAPDVIYLDPMFSGVAKKSALPRLDMQLMRSWLGEDDSGAELVEEARRLALKRVVVKRLAKAEELLHGVTHSFLGAKVRYDMYLSRP